MKKNKSIEKKIIKILKDLFHLVKYDLDELENMEKDYWHYDRPMFLRKNAGDKIDKKYSYDIDLETLKTMVFQIGLFSKIPSMILAYNVVDAVRKFQASAKSLKPCNSF